MKIGKWDEVQQVDERGGEKNDVHLETNTKRQEKWSQSGKLA